MMEKKLTNSGPFMESTGKHSIYSHMPIFRTPRSMHGSPR